ncbi:MAG: magnesium transporter [Oscillospiraceae bacterium]|jgi:magnesium transporter|nr:magnesium transporter [Oscillospiraceae bacterium]
MTDINIQQELLDLVGSSDIHKIVAGLQNANPVDVAESFEEFFEKNEPESHQKLLIIFRLLPKDYAAELFAELNPDIQESIITKITDYEIRGIVDEMFLDDAVDFIEEMPASVIARVLANIPRQRREEINSFLKYPENSAGSLMTNEYIDLKVGMTVSQTFEKIRKDGQDKETIYTCYVTDSSRRLLGTVTVKTLLLSRMDEIINDIMDTSFISAFTTDTAEDVAADFRKYGLLALPIVDSEKRIVGIVTVDDIMEVAEEVATEDFEKMAAITPSEEPYLKTSVFNLTKHRLLWLLILMISATVTGAIISHFEDALAALPILFASVPMLMDTGGNAGAQSSTLIIRGMAVGEIELADILRVLWKEFRVALVCGASLAAVNIVRMLIVNQKQNILVSLTVSLALVATVVLAKTVGCLLPMAAKKLKLDPAVMASPVITTIVDAGSLIVFFFFARLLLHV